MPEQEMKKETERAVKVSKTKKDDLSLGNRKLYIKPDSESTRTIEIIKSNNKRVLKKISTRTYKDANGKVVMKKNRLVHSGK
jgi:hypothetical protein